MATTPPADAMSAAWAAMHAQLNLEHPDDRRTWESGTGEVTLTISTLRQLLTSGLAAAAQHLAPAPDGQRVEVITYRDPDLYDRAGDRHTVFINGISVQQVERTVIDPSATGVVDEDSWNERCAVSAATASPLAAQRIRDYAALGAETNYVTGHPDLRDPYVEVKWTATTTTEYTAQIPRGVLLAAAKQTDEALVDEDGTLAATLFYGLVYGPAFHTLLAQYELDPPDDAGTRDWISVVDPAPDLAAYVITGSDTNPADPNEENHDGR